MATVNKDFKIKSGLIVEGTTATVNGYDILTKKTDDQNYIIGLIGGSATSNATPNTVVLRDGAGSFSANVITASTFNGDVLGTVSDISNHDTDSLAEGTTNLYYANSLAREAFSGGDGIAYDSATGVIEADLGNGIAFGPEAEIIIDRTTVDTWYDASGTGASEAANAYSSATSYTDDAITNLNLGGTYDALGAADTAYNNAIAYAEGYTDNAVAALVDSAPEMLDTLNELAQALQDNPNVIADLQDVAAGKQDTLIAGSNIDITGNTISVTGLDSADISDFNTAALSATSAAYDAAGSAANAQAAAESTAQGYANTAYDNAVAYADSLTTDDVAEGLSNEYFTDSRAKTSAADLLTGATLSNITITGNGSGLTITAENGVAGSTTDDLTEGSTNLYFTDQRVLDATSNATSVEVQKLDISWVRREEAAYASVATASTETVHSFGTNEGSVKYLVRVYNNNKSHVTEVLATTDSDHNVAVVEYGTIYTSENPLATATVVWNAVTSQYDLNVTTANNNSEVLVAATLLAYND